MTYTISQIAAALAAEAAGDLSIEVKRPAHPGAAGTMDIALAMDPKYFDSVKDSPARAAILPAGAPWEDLGLEAAIFVGRSRYALSKLTTAFAHPIHAPAGVHPSAVVDDSAILEGNVSIGPLCVVGPGAKIGAGCRLLSGSTVGENASLGPDGLLHSGSRVGARVRIGARVILQPNAVVGSDGFSFVTPEKGSVETAKSGEAITDEVRNVELARIHSLGAVVLGDDVEVGANSSIDRGTMIDTRVGSGTKIDNLVQIGHNVQVGEHCMLCGHVGIAGSTEIGDRVVLAGKVGVADHVKIGEDSVIGANSGVGANVPPRSVLLGLPALPAGDTARIVAAQKRLPDLFQTVRELKKRLSAIEPTR